MSQKSRKLKSVNTQNASTQQVDNSAPHQQALCSTYEGAPALLTDMYELTMVDAAILAEKRTGKKVASRTCTFEIFSRRLPNERRYGVVVGTGRFLEQLQNFRFTEKHIDYCRDFLSEDTLEWMRNYTFTGSISGYREGELYFPGSPILTIQGTFAECVVLETLALSILNHDSAIGSAAARMSAAADGRTIIEMGARRTHEESAVAAARAAYIAGFTSTSDIAAGYRWGLPIGGTAAHAFTLLHTTDHQADEKEAFRNQVAAMGTDTTLLVDTYDITQGVANAIEVAGPELGGVRIDSGDLGVLARQVRQQLDSLGAHNTHIVVSGDLDEFSIAALRAEPVDAYGVGTALVTGSGAPTAELVYKLVEVEGQRVAKRSSHKETRGGAKQGFRTARDTGTMVSEIVTPLGAEEPDTGTLQCEKLTIDYMVDGVVQDNLPTLEDARKLLYRNLRQLPWEGLSLSRGEPAIPTEFQGF